MEVEAYPVGHLTDHVLVVVLASNSDGLLFGRHRERSTWEFPGGHIEEGETPIEAAVRELWEESATRPLQILPACDYTVDGVPGRCFTAHVGAPEGALAAEIVECRSFPAPPEELTYPDVVHLLLALHLPLIG